MSYNTPGLFDNSLLSLAGQQGKECLCVFIEYEIFCRDPIAFSLLILVINSRGHVCYMVTDQIDIDEKTLPTVLYKTKNGMTKREFIENMGFKPDVWIG